MQCSAASSFPAHAEHLIDTEIELDDDEPLRHLSQFRWSEELFLGITEFVDNINGPELEWH